MSAGGRRTPRLFVQTVPAAGEPFPLSRDAAQHVRALRLEVGAQVELFDACGLCAPAQLVAGPGRGSWALPEAARPVPAPNNTLSIIAGLPKGQKLDGVVRMLTELGVDALQPAHTERTQVPAAAFGPSRQQRWERIAVEACAQSGQARVPRIAPPLPLLEAASQAPEDALRLVFWERAPSPLGALPEAAASGAALWVVVGPEGGLSEAEVRALEALGYRPVGLGGPILRVETALVTVAGLLLDRMGRLA